MLNNILPITNLLLIITISIFALHSFYYLKKHREHKNKMVNEMSSLYPLVKPEFYNQPLAQQTIENNHEIHELNEKYAKMNAILEEIKKELKIKENG